MKNLNELKNPPKEYRGAPFWAWNSSLDKARLEFQLKELKDMGFGGAHIHARVGLEVPYLSEEFLDMMGFSIEKAKELDMLTYLYDEDRWPSGYGSGIVTKEKKYRAIHLLFTTTPYENSVVEEKIIYKANFAVGVRTNQGQLLGIYDVVLDSDGMLQSFARIEEGDEVNGVKWYAYIEENPPHTWYNDGAYVDVLNKEAIDLFLDTSYKIYRERFGEDFGSWIPSIFTDEPHMIFKTNLETPFSTEDQFLPWTWSLEEECLKRYGVSVPENLPLLFWETNRDNLKVRYAFHRVLADLFDEAFAKNIGDWCRKNNIAFTGHYLYEETLFQQNRSDGDLMRMYRNMDIPGMDLLFDEVDMTTGKQIQSIVHQYGKKGAMSEEYGVTNWAFELRDYLFQSDWQAALGINKRVPHLSLLSMKGEAKRDFPASISYQAPWAKEMKIVEEHCARINMLLEDGKPTERVAVIHPLESYWLKFGPESQTDELRKQLDDNFQNITKWLLTNGVAFDYLDEELMPELYSSQTRTFGLMKYDVIILPALYGIRSSTVEILGEFEKNAGEVLIWGEKPEYLDGVKQEDVLQGIGKIIDCSKEALLDSVKGYRNIQYFNEKGQAEESLICHLKKEDSSGVLFAASVKKPSDMDDPEKKKVTFRIQGGYAISEYDTFENQYQKIDSRQEDGWTVFESEFYEGNSKVFLLNAPLEVEQVDKTEGITWHKIAVPGSVSYDLEESNVALLDMPEYSLDHGEFQTREEILKIDVKMRKYLGYRARSFNMAQPYSYKTRDEEHLLTLRYVFKSECVHRDVWLALEELEQCEITWNGKKIDVTPIGWYVDQEIQKILLGDVLEGENILEVSIRYRENTNLEPMYLLGDFAVNVEGDKFQLAKKAETVRFDNLVGQGFDFYGGNIRYRFLVSCPEGKLKICIPKYRGSSVGIEIDGVKQKRNIIQAPFTFELSEMEKGEHEITLILYGNRYNTFSHLHDSNAADEYRSFPLLWRTEGEQWSYEYQLRTMGIIEIPELYV